MLAKLLRDTVDGAKHWQGQTATQGKVEMLLEARLET